MLNLKPLQHFVLVAEEGSFQKAAERAHVTQPALSISIKSLENNVDLVLFERDQRPIKLTVAGQEMLRIARKLLFEARNLDQAITNFKQGRAGSLKVGFAPNFSASFGGSAVAEWVRRCAGVKIRVETDSNERLVEHLRSEELDLIICDATAVSDPTDLAFENIPAQGAGYFCRPDHPVLSLTQPTVADLGQHALAVVNLPPRLLRRVAETLGDTLRFEDALTVQSNTVSILKDATIEGDTILLSLRRSIRHELRAGILKEIPLAMPLTATWAIATIKGRILHPAATVMTDVIKELATEFVGNS